MSKKPTQKNLPKFITLSAGSVAMTALFAFLGAIPLRGLKTAAGSFTYWALGLIVSGILLGIEQYYLAGAYACLVLVVGAFSELEDMELSRGWAAFWAVSLVSLVFSAGLAFWIASVGKVWWSQLLALMEVPLNQVLKINPETTITSKDLLLQTPAVLIILSILALYVSMLFEPRVLKLFKQAPVQRMSLKKLKVSDAMIWIFLASLLGAFLNHKVEVIKVVSLNGFYVMITLYFFQGLAIVSELFEKIKLGAAWQLFGYFILITQLMLLLCLVGIADFWFDFRSRLKKSKQEEINREIF
ncbi:MAG: DUF2232 domain-containing protein [Bdellovibrionales bacterium]|nr:DUF2232 domain-containing protein [Bdellovibrionales bacterium]